MKVIRLSKFLLLTVGFVALFFQSCRDYKIDPATDLSAHKYDSEVYLRWNEVFLELDRYARGYRPGPAPRALGYLGISAYEAVVTGIPENRSLQHFLPGLEVPEADKDLEYYWPACVNESYYFLMKRFFFYMENEYPTLYQKIDQTRLLLRNEFLNETTLEILERSEAHGESVAAAVYEWEKLDAAGHDAFLTPQPDSYNPPAGPGLWQPTFPDYSKAMFPYWGQVRTFAIKTGDKLSKPPIPYSEHPQSLFYNQGLEVYNTVNLINNPKPDEATLAYNLYWIAIFWSDDILNFTFSPPARLVAIANQVVDKERLDLAGSAELYAKMGLALSDAGVATWHSKYYYNLERPISYIRRVISQQHPAAANWKTILDNPYNNFKGMTPAFPAYPSGHSAFGGAGAKILSSFFEYNSHHPGTYSFTDLCHKDRSDFIGTPRTFSSFKQLADEDAYSRIPLGVHFKMDCDEGLRLGELAAQRVLELPWKR